MDVKLRFISIYDVFHSSFYCIFKEIFRILHASKIGLPQATAMKTVGFMDHLNVGFILMYRKTPSINIHMNTDV